MGSYKSYSKSVSKLNCSPLLIFIGIGAMIDFGPLLQNPFIFIIQVQHNSVFSFVVVVAVLFRIRYSWLPSIRCYRCDRRSYFYLRREPLAPQLLGAITVAAYSPMALVPIINQSQSKMVTTKAERRIRMTYHASGVSKLTAKSCSPIIITIVASFIAPISLPLVGFLMFKLITPMWRF